MAKVCYNCKKKLHGNCISCTNCGAHQWREGTDKMTVEQLKEYADEEFRQGKMGNTEAHNAHTDKSMFIYQLIVERIDNMMPRLEALEPMENCIHMLDYIIMQERRAGFSGDERRQARYKEMMQRITNKKENLLLDRMERARKIEEENAPAPEVKEKKTVNVPDKLDELVDFAIFTVSEMDEMGSWTFLGKPRTKNYMISMFSFLREIKDQLPTLEQKEREVLLHVMFQVADSYEKGTYPVPQDPIRAIDWHIEASNRGLVLSELAIGDIYLKGSGGMRAQPEKAKEWYEKALETDSSPKVTEYAKAALAHIETLM